MQGYCAREKTPWLNRTIRKTLSSRPGQPVPHPPSPVHPARPNRPPRGLPAPPVPRPPSPANREPLVLLSPVNLPNPASGRSPLGQDHRPHKG